MFIGQNFTNPVSSALIILHKIVSLTSTQEFKLLQDIDDCLPLSERSTYVNKFSIS